MPIVIPTAEEVDNMSHAQRAKWRKRMGLATEQVALTRAALLGVDRIQADAQAIHAYLGPDPDAQLHRQQLLEALQ